MISYFRTFNNILYGYDVLLIILYTISVYYSRIPLFCIMLSVAVGYYQFNFFKMIFLDWFIIYNFWFPILLHNDTNLIGLQIR